MVLWSVAVGGSMFQLVQYARVSTITLGLCILLNKVILIRSIYPLINYLPRPLHTPLFRYTGKGSKGWRVGVDYRSCGTTDMHD